MALDLLLFGQVCAPTGASRDAVDGSTRPRPHQGESFRRSAAPDVAPRGGSWLPEYRELGMLPPAQVRVVVSLATLLGADDGVGELPGYGFLTAQHVRQIALAEGFGVDPAGGRPGGRPMHRAEHRRLRTG